jgi:DNA polymerase
MTQYRLNVCDLNAIETRVGAWVAQCQSLMDVFIPYTDPLGNFHRNGKDSYCAFAVKVYPVYTYEKLFLDKEGHNGKAAKTEAKIKRQFGKIGVLGSIYRMGGGDWGNGKASYIDHVDGCPHAKSKRHVCDCPKIYDRVRTGLWGFAYGQGVDMERKDAHMVTDVFRASYPEICGNGYGGQPKGIWVQLEEAVLDVMNPDATNTKRHIGPNGCIVIDRLNIGQVNVQGEWVKTRNPMMRITLPSGRRLHYMDAYISNKEMAWKRDGESVYKPTLHYMQEDDKGNWRPFDSHGGKLFENIVQGIARDVLVVKMLEFEEHDLPVVGHVHDEGISITPNDLFSPGLPEMVDIMSTPIDWAPGLLLGADGFEGSFYHK